MATVEVDGIRRSFDGRTVLDGLDLRVADGSTTVLLGSSGSGKSTLLRTIAGIDRPDAGRVHIDGVDVTDVAPHRRGVGFVFQRPALFPHLDVGGNVAYGLRRAARRARPGHRGPAVDQRVDEVLDSVGLAGFARRDPGTLSGGEAQRVALARALAPRPSIVLLDEPLAALDQVLRDAILFELRRVFDDLGVTVLAVTHDPAEAGVLGERIAVLVDGTIAQEGPATAVLERPVDRRTAGLVGHRNLASGTIRDGTITTPWGRFPLERTDRASGSTDRAAASTGRAPASTGRAAASTGRAAVLVPPGALHADPAGDLHGIVEGRMFRGGVPMAVVRGEDWPALDLVAPAGWAVGDRVRVRVDPARVVVLDEATDPDR